jgi:predicted HAD superfamily Cof-like phosphohydrolase
MPVVCLRYDLMAEELAEVDQAMADVLHVEDLPDLAKELADLLYVVYGTAVTFGIDIDKVFAEVHSSNMSKLGVDGKPIYREDGKVLKGPNYAPPNLEWVAKEYAI